jgi:MATE family multidrug resistance protein
MMTTMLFSTACVYLPLWYVTQGWGNHGLWFAFSAFNAARGITLYYYFRRLNRTRGWLRPTGQESR